MNRNHVKMKSTPEFSDNTRVKHGRGLYYNNEFLTLNMRPKTDDRPFLVYLCRYCVPGRCDTYSFSLEDEKFGPKHLTFYSDGFYTNLPEAIRLFTEDIEKPQVVEMILNAFSADQVLLYYYHDFRDLVELITPKAKILRKVKRMYDALLKKRAQLYSEGKLKI